MTSNFSINQEGTWGIWNNTSTTTSASSCDTSSSIVWRKWNEQATTDAHTCITSSTDSTIWTGWNIGTSTASDSSSIVWRTWVSDSTAPINNNRNNVIISRPAPVQVPPTIRDMEEQRKIFINKKKKAELRSQELLKSIIGKRQFEVYLKTGRVMVKGLKNNYIIRKEGKILRYNKIEAGDLCVHLENRYKYPETDNVVALILALQAEEEKILKLGNHSNIIPRSKLVIPKSAHAPVN